ncbi:hypothetical protein CICLE_v10013855mg [Citrus x clementina]|uniref:Uncharacterized protein n=1 Tax=Citrus clementina TaxID=85681 RepID=V4T084_CITCL|nr:hypothetical protein CICLE_v10013855mg [Citrus x clementina]
MNNHTMKLLVLLFSIVHFIIAQRPEIETKIFMSLPYNSGDEATEFCREILYLASSLREILLYDSWLISNT